MAVWSLLSPLLLFACATGPDTPASPSERAERHSDPLDTVPADTPYLLATPSPVPPGQLEQFVLAQLELRANPRANDPPPYLDVHELIQTFAEHAWGRRETESLSLGLPDRFNLTCYGLDLYPTCRIGLNSSDAFLDGWRQLEREVRLEPRVSTFEYGDVRRYELTRGLTMVVTAREDEAVLGIAPRDDVETFARHAHRREVPARSLADTDRLRRTLDAYGFEGAATGWIQTRRVLELALGGAPGHVEEETEPNRIYQSRFASMLGFDEPADRTAPETSARRCREEWLGLAGEVPRVVYGFQRIGPDRGEVSVTLVLDGRWLDVLEQVTAAASTFELEDSSSQPERTQITSSIRIGPLAKILATEARQLRAEPFRCPSLRPVAATTIRLARAMQRLPPWSRALRSIDARLGDVETRRGTISKVDGDLAATFETPKFAEQFVRNIADAPSWEPPEEGKSVTIDLTERLGFLEPATVALRGPHLAVGSTAGETLQTRLSNHATAGEAEPVPLLAFRNGTKAPDLGRFLSLGSNRTAKSRATPSSESRGSQSLQTDSREPSRPYSMRFGFGTTTGSTMRAAGLFANPRGVQLRLQLSSSNE